MPLTMLKRMSVATGVGLVAAALVGARSQRAADRWNATKVARGVSVRGRNLVLHAPHKVGGKGSKGRWHFQAEDCRRQRRIRVLPP